MDKKRFPVDDFFRQSLEQHTITPSGEAKKKFLIDATAIMSRSRSRRWIIYLSGIVILIVTMVAIRMNMPALIKSNLNNSSVSEPVSTAPALKAKPTTEQQSLLTSSSNAPLNLTANKQRSITNTSPTPLKSTTTETSSTFSKYPDKNLHVQKKEPKQNKMQTGADPVSKPTVSHEIAALTSIASRDEIPPLQNVPIEETKIQSQPAIDEGKKVKADTLPKEKEKPSDSVKEVKKSTPKKSSILYTTPRMINFTTGLYYSPEWLYNIIGSEKYVTSFGVEGAFHFGPYSIRTGVGLSTTKGTNELSISYNEYLGSYLHLDSITFTWDGQQNRYVPKYYMSKKDVWDSIQKLENQKIVKRYTYLQIPLILGYDFWSNEQFSIGARVGPIFSLLVYSKQLTDNYDPGKDKIILINEISPERIQTNWQILLGVNFGFGSSRRFGMEFEPDFRYYFNSVYEKSNSNQRPWSIGFRLALLLKY